MLQYTYNTLRNRLKNWVEGNGADADDDFVDALDEIIQAAEARVYRDLDIATLDTSDTTTINTADEVFAKPADLISEEVLIAALLEPVTPVIVQLQKRSRAFVAAFNATAAAGAPRYYAESDTANWALAPPADGDYTVTVHGMYLPASITDGAVANTTTWLSTRLPDVLAHACEIEACAYLKNWTLKAEKEKDYLGKLDDARAITENQRRTNVGDIMGMRAKARQATGPDPAGTP